jgi:hypothetical protein
MIAVLTPSLIAATPVPADADFSYKLKRYEKAVEKPKSGTSTNSVRPGSHQSSTQTRPSEKSAASQPSGHTSSLSDYQATLTKNHRARRGSRHSQYTSESNADYTFRPNRRFKRRRNRSFRHLHELYISKIDSLESELNDLAEEAPLTEEETLYVNGLLDKVEDRQGRFNVQYGRTSDLSSADGISGRQGRFSFFTPNVYSQNGMSFGSWGLGFEHKSLFESGFGLTYNRYFLQARTSQLNVQTASTWGALIGLVFLDGENVHKGLTVGLNYNFSDLNHFYSFHFNYNANIFNLNSAQFENVLESNVESFFRFHMGPGSIDLGAEVNILGLDTDSQYHQVFARTGIRF